MFSALDTNLEYVKVGLDHHRTTSVLSIGVPDAGIDATPHSLAKGWVDLAF
jgi:hypothetical protein